MNALNLNRKLLNEALRQAPNQTYRTDLKRLPVQESPNETPHFRGASDRLPGTRHLIRWEL